MNWLYRNRFSVFDALVVIMTLFLLIEERWIEAVGFMTVMAAISILIGKRS